jgi:phosphatidylinositol glycan class M
MEFSIFSTVGIVLQIILGWKFKSDIPVAMFLQTISFVAFNKVATAQYFVWYIQWLPFVFPKIALARRSKATLIMLSIAWLASLGNWLTWAYQLEFKGAGVHFFVWLAGLLWVIANAVLIREVVITFLDSDGRPKGKGIIKEA